MTTAYILLNTEIGATNQVLKKLRDIEGIEEVYNLWGVYDILANVKAENMENLKHIITNRIEKIGQINSKLTMIITDQTPPQEPPMFEPIQELISKQPTVLG